MDGDCDSDSLVLEDETDDDDYDDWYPYLDEYFCVEKTPPNLCCLQPLGMNPFSNVPLRSF